MTQLGEALPVNSARCRSATGCTAGIGAPKHHGRSDALSGQVTYRYLYAVFPLAARRLMTQYICLKINVGLASPLPYTNLIMNPITITAKQLRQAANIQEKIQSLQKELNQILGAPAEGFSGEMPDGRWKKTHRMSAAGRAAIAAAARARWAKLRGKAPKRRLSAAGLANIRAGVVKRMAALRGAKAAAKPAPKRVISAAGKARLSALAKARWKKAKAAGKAKL